MVKAYVLKEVEVKSSFPFTEAAYFCMEMPSPQTALAPSKETAPCTAESLRSAYTSGSNDLSAPSPKLFSTVLGLNASLLPELSAAKIFEHPKKKLRKKIEIPALEYEKFVADVRKKLPDINAFIIASPTKTIIC
ncbi:MAG: hypothetical protein LBB29_01115 [Holosporaceae bacterium]|jgi:hypothetical protein|nr:hypothetical protein [Holosporaceae bacterium]